MAMCLIVANPQRVVEERDAAEEKATILEYELRLAKDDINRLQEKLERHTSAISTPYSSSNAFFLSTLLIPILGFIVKM